MFLQLTLFMTIRHRVVPLEPSVSDWIAPREAGRRPQRRAYPRRAQGYDTVLDQRGSNLSLGQRQLLSFARALVVDAPILVLDEATANVDSYTERQIQKALARLLEGRTAIVIAHRLATIRGAARILVLRDGRLVEQGTHDGLIALGGLYARLYRLNYASLHRRYHEDLYAAVVAAARAGQDLEQMKASITLDAYKGWGAYADWRELNIEGIHARVLLQRRGN